MTRRSWIQIALLALLGLSIALNVFMIGFAAHGLRGAGAGRALINEIASIYPPQVRKEFRVVLRENRPRTFAALRDLRTARAGLATAMNVSPVDEAAVRTAMKNVRDATANLQATIQDYLLTALKRTEPKQGT